jgi:hypothetical protein
MWAIATDKCHRCRATPDSRARLSDSPDLTAVSVPPAAPVVAFDRTNPTTNMQDFDQPDRADQGVGGRTDHPFQ